MRNKCIGDVFISDAEFIKKHPDVDKETFEKVCDKMIEYINKHHDRRIKSNE